jgi:hypothetical protein
MRCRLLVILHLLIIVGLLLAIIIGNMSRANAEVSQLDRSQWGIGVGDGREDRDVRELLEQLIPLAVNNLLVVLHNLQVLFHDIQALIRAPTHHKDASGHLQKAVVGAGGRRGTTAASTVRRSSRKTSTRSPHILWHYGVKRIMSWVMVEFLLGHHLNHVLNIWSKATWSKRFGGYVSYLIYNVLKDVKAHRLDESIHVRQTHFKIRQMFLCGVSEGNQMILFL